jgi:hypothetical protein
VSVDQIADGRMDDSVEAGDSGDSRSGRVRHGADRGRKTAGVRNPANRSMGEYSSG